METTFGRDNPQIVVVSGNVGGGPVQTRTFDRSDSVQALSAFLKDRKLSRPRTMVAAHAAAIARANQPAGSVSLMASNLSSRLAYRPAGADHPRPATFSPEPAVMSTPTRAGRMIELD